MRKETDETAVASRDGLSGMAPHVCLKAGSPLHPLFAAGPMPHPDMLPSCIDDFDDAFGGATRRVEDHARHQD